MNWTTKKLDEICEINLGKTPSRSNKSFWDHEKLGKNKWISIADLTKLDQRFIFDSKEYISDKGASLFKPVKAGTLMMSFKLSIGKLAYAGCDIYTNEAIVALPIKNFDEISKEYLYYFLSFYDWDKEAENDIKLKGKTLNKAKLKTIKVSFPVPKIQKEIVSKLDAISAQLEKALNSTKTNIKNAEVLFQSHLTRVFESYKDTYSSTTLGNYYDVRDGTHESPKFYDSGYPLVTSKNLKNGEINFEKVQYICKEDYLSISLRSDVKKGDVLMAMIGTIGNPVVVETESEFAIKNIALFKINNNQSSNFLRYYLSSSYVINKMHKEAKGATQKFVGLGYLRSFPISIPSLDIQIKIVNELENCEKYIKKLLGFYILKLNNLQKLKQSIFQQIFSDFTTGDQN
jgi:type I restriction enzyme S subunit